MTADLLRILYVDDDDALLQIGRLFLEQDKQFSVDTILSASAALSLLDSKKFDAIISDYQMPKMDGIEFLKRVRASGNTIPFILFTGRGREEVVIQALNEGADFYLQKGGEPISQFAELAHKIRQAVQQRRAERSIRDHEQREADIINFLPDATFAIDTNGVMIAWNRAMEEMTGVIAADILGKGDFEYALPFYHERRPILIDLVLKDDPATEAKYPYVRRSGKKLFSEIFIPQMNNGTGALLWFTASPLYDTKGTIIGAIESIRDITDRKQSEERLRFSERKFAAAFDASPDPMAMTDLASGLIHEVNHSFEIWSGYSRDEIIGRTTRDLNFWVYPEERDTVVALLNAQKGVHKKDVTLRTKSGETRSISFSAKVFGIEGSMYMLSVADDITDRKKAEESLRETNEYLRNLIDYANAPIIVWDPQFRITRFNHAFENLTGWAEQDVLGKHLDLLFSGESRDISLKNIQRTLVGDRWESVEIPILIKDGRKRVVLWNSANILDSDNRIVSTIAQGVDVTELKQAEERRRIYNEHMRLAQEIGQVGSWELSIATGTIWASEEAFRIFDVPRSANGLIYLEEVEARIVERDMVHQALVDLIETGKKYDLEYAIEPDDRSGRKIIHSVAKILYDGGKKPVGIAGVIQDITGRKQAEGALRKSEEKYRTVLENIQDIFYRSDAEGRLIMASPSWAALLGYDTLDECLGHGIAETFYYEPATRGPFLQEVQDQGRVDNYEVTLKRKDGSPVMVSTNSHIYYHDDGSPAGVEGIFRDVTEIKQKESILLKNTEELRAANEQIAAAEEELRSNMDELGRQEQALRESKKELEDIISFLPDATFAIDRNGRVIAWNLAIEKMTGIPAEQMLGKGDYEYAVPFYGERRPILIDLIFRNETELKNYSTVRRDGTTLIAETGRAHLGGKNLVLWGKASPLYNSAGDIIGAIESIRDFTERRRIEDSLSQLNKKLNLLSSVTRHDIINSISVCKGYLALLKQKSPDAEMQTFINALEESIGTIQAQIEFTRVYQDLGAAEPVWQDIGMVLGKCSGAEKIPVESTVSDLEVFAEPLIGKVFYNLYDNTVRHGGHASAIRIIQEKRGDEMVIIWEDNGAGVPAEDKERIFEREFGKNTGLGLFLAREILLITGITIRETGEAGKGARFEITIPKEVWRNSRKQE